MADHPELTITVLGCSGTYSSAVSSCSSYLVRSATTTVLVDAGPGSSMELQRHVTFHDLDGIIISHEHADHWTELPSIYHAVRYGVERPIIPTWGTAGTRRLLDLAVPEARNHAFEWTTIDESSRVNIGDIDFSFSQTDHPVETLAIRAESNGKSIAYTSDTGPGWSPSSFEAPIDVLVSEATLPAELADQGIPHVSGRDAGASAAEVGAKLLVLTHVPPQNDPEERRIGATAVFDGRVEIAAPGRRFAA